MPKIISTVFSEHPATVGETYSEHFLTASKFSILMLYGSFVCLVHAVLPCLFTKTGSATVTRLHQMMVTGRTKHVRLADGNEQQSPLQDGR